LILGTGIEKKVVKVGNYKLLKNTKI